MPSFKFTTADEKTTGRAGDHRHPSGPTGGKEIFSVVSA